MTSETDLLARLRRCRIVPVVLLDQLDHAVPLAQALARAGVDVIEVTLRTPVALDCIRAIARQCPQVLVGAGTVLNLAQWREALDAGSGFGLSPGLDEATVKQARADGVPFMPGVATPSEAMRALALGCKVVKFFPAQYVGGVKLLEALASPLPELRFIPTGGVDAANAVSYAKLPNVLAVGGSWIVPRARIQAGDFAAIENLAREARAQLEGVMPL